jgi:hypothetical protein
MLLFSKVVEKRSCCRHLKEYKSIVIEKKQSIRMYSRLLRKRIIVTLLAF